MAKEEAIEEVAVVEPILSGATTVTSGRFPLLVRVVRL